MLQEVMRAYHLRVETVMDIVRGFIKQIKVHLNQ